MIADEMERARPDEEWPEISRSVAVVIPTYGRGFKVCDTLRRIRACRPRPAEIWIHIDASDGSLAQHLSAEFPEVQVIASPTRLGPGGGRHACLQKCTAPFVASLDDDSYPVDTDFFGRVETLFTAHLEAAVITASIWHRNEREIPLGTAFTMQPSYVGCGHAIRLSDYRSIPGYIPRHIPYGIEETDVALQLYARRRGIFRANALRVFHDTELMHHTQPEIVQGVVVNSALLAFLRYPIRLWPLGLAQLMSTLLFCIRLGRWRGIASGLATIPRECRRFRHYRKVLPAGAVMQYVLFRRRQPRCDDAA